VRRTKIVATVGPACDRDDQLAGLLEAGVDVFRLNFSHGTHASHAATATRIRAAAGATGRRVAIMQDLSGPKIRTGPLNGPPLVLEKGAELLIGTGDTAGRPGQVFTPYEPLVASARPGDRLLLDDGRIELRVTAAGSPLRTTVVHGGTLGAHKGINAPGVALPDSALTDKDLDDLRFGLTLGVDFVALSFVQTAADLERARAEVAGAGRPIQLVAKIERPGAVRNLDAILAAADAVMVARGDLGLELPLEQVPRVQKEIIGRARLAGRPVIVATQVLESMRVEPRPTRAEVSDAAKAVDEGADAIMLAGETAAGAFPVRSVQTLDAVIRDAESVPRPVETRPTIDPIGSLHGRALCEAAVTLASTGHADAIIAVTSEGKTARILSSLRPSAEVHAATPTDRVAASLALCWGVRPFVTDERDVERLEQLILGRGLLAAGSTVVFVSVSPELTRADANFLNVQRLG
jgi:pyruvate kinase